MTGGDRQPPALLFVCLGNICRSPMAAGIARKMFPEEVNVESAGIAPYGGSAAPEAIEVMKNGFDVDLRGHRSRGVTEFALDAFDVIIAMDAHVYAHLKNNYQVDSGKLIRWEIGDPFLRDLEAFRECARDIDGCMNEIRRIVKERLGCEI
jgi:protein-tyrosine phosphatase